MQYFSVNVKKFNLVLVMAERTSSAIWSETPTTSAVMNTSVGAVEGGQSSYGKVLTAVMQSVLCIAFFDLTNSQQRLVVVLGLFFCHAWATCVPQFM
jgi:hypothetical protein